MASKDRMAQKKLIKEKCQDIALYTMEHTKNATAAHFEISTGGVDSALCQAGLPEKASASFRAIIKNRHGRKYNGKSKLIAVQDKRTYIITEDVVTKIKDDTTGEYTATVLVGILHETFDKVIKLNEKNLALEKEILEKDETIQQLTAKLEGTSRDLSKVKKINADMLLQKVASSLATPGD